MQAVAIGQREIEVLDQRGEFRGDGDFGRGDDDCPTVGGELLAYVAQAAHDDGVVHVAVKVFQDEDGFERRRLHVGEGLHGFAGVVDGCAGGCARSAGSQGGGHRESESVGFRAAGAERGSHLRIGASGLGSHVDWSMRSCSVVFCASTGAFVPERSRPSAMVHSKVAMLSWLQAARTMLTACVSSDVSITMMGVEELMSTLRRSRPSVMIGTRYSAR